MKRAKRHILFWILYVSFTVSTYYVKEPTLGLHIVYELASLPAKFLMVYYLLYFILPHYLLKKNYGQALLQFSLTLVISVWLLHLSVSSIVYPIYFPDAAIVLIPNHLPKLVAPSLDLIIASSLAITIKLLKDRENQERNRLQLEKINVQNELQLLKSQLHPHFLFNTLNGLYAYTLEQPELAAKIVVKLSNLLRFIIYEGNKALVNLVEDLDCLRNYMNLEQIRYGDRLKTTFLVSGTIQQQKIVPLLLLPFIENAFKHGPAKGYEKSWITCNIQVKAQALMMNLSNSKVSNNEAIKSQHGIGLKNVKQRLTFYYSNQYELNIDNQPDQFSVTLKIPLTLV